MFIFTDISRDGMLQGINVQQLISIARSCGKKVIASGGVRSIHDIQKLLRCRCQNIEGVIVGKALYTGHISLEKALAIVGQSQRFWKKGEHSSL
jgi:phosphoribosylformimino-5-aminoimidazole carboxamide ribotide isomerase